MRTLFLAADRAVRLREGVGEVITGFSVAPGPVEENEGRLDRTEARAPVGEE
jgi:hypothetical protein